MILNDVLAALTSMFEAAVAPVRVYDVPDPSAVNNAKWVAVGTEGDEDADTATVDLTPSSLGPGTWIDESGEILCSAWAQAGGTDIDARRREAGELAEACVAAVRADDTLGGLLAVDRRAQVSSISYRPRQGKTGTLCTFTFTVSYQHLNT